MAIEWGLRVEKFFRGVPLRIPFFGGRYGVFVRKTRVMDKHSHKLEGNQPGGNFLTGSDRPYKLLAREMGGRGGGWGERTVVVLPAPPPVFFCRVGGRNGYAWPYGGGRLGLSIENISRGVSLLDPYF